MSDETEEAVFTALEDPHFEADFYRWASHMVVRRLRPRPEVRQLVEYLNQCSSIRDLVESKMELWFEELQSGHELESTPRIAAVLVALAETKDLEYACEIYNLINNANLAEIVTLRVVAKDLLYPLKDREKPATPDPRTEHEQICEALHLVPEATTEMILESIRNTRREVRDAIEKLAPYCPECEPSRTSLSGVVSLLIGDVLEPGLKAVRTERGENWKPKGTLHLVGELEENDHE